MASKTIIRQFAKKNNHEIIGKLTRHQELEQLNENDNLDRRYQFYLDEGDNEYWVDTKTGGVSCVTKDGGVF